MNQQKDFVAQPVGYMDKTKFKMLVIGASVTTTLTSHRASKDDVALYSEVPSAPVQEPVPDDVQMYAKAMQEDGYRGPLHWARSIIDWVAKQAAAPQPQRDDTALIRQALEALRQCQFTTPPAQRNIVIAAIAAIRERLK
jgi:hypothetical protein